MPIYEYECSSCCTVFEVFQRMTEGPVTVCPDCSGPVKKLMSQSSFQLKGGGWYSDGYCSQTNNSSGSAATVSTTEKTKEKTAEAAEAPKSSPDKGGAATSKADCSATT